MCLFAISGPPVRRELSIIRIYICILLTFCDFTKMENARTREMEIGRLRGANTHRRILLFAQTNINLGELMCLLTLLRPPVRRENAMICICIYIIDFPGIPKTRKHSLACANLVPPQKTRKLTLACLQKRRTTLEGVVSNNTYIYISLLFHNCYEKHKRART